MPVLGRSSNQRLVVDGAGDKAVQQQQLCHAYLSNLSNLSNRNRFIHNSNVYIYKPVFFKI